MHEAENYEDYADLVAFELDDLAQGGEGVGGFEGEGYVADVDEVEADDEEVVDGVCELFVAVEGVDEEDPSVLVQGAGDPDCEGDTDGEVAEVNGCDVHGFSSVIAYSEHVQY